MFGTDSCLSKICFQKSKAKKRKEKGTGNMLS